MYATAMEFGNLINIQRFIRIRSRVLVIDAMIILIEEFPKVDIRLRVV